jgi:predicted RNase H-like nuclease
MATALGIDGCRDGWFYFRFDDGVGTFGVADSVAELVADLPDDACALIDIPIGLRARGKRERLCDVAARERLGPRRASVFAAPLRPALRAKDYASANAQQKRLSGRGLSRQTWNIVPKIREVDQLMRADEHARELLREAHPELVFAGLAGGPMSHPKKTRDGFTERMTILSILHPDAETLVASAYLAHGGFDASRDDLVDAFVLALAATRADELIGLPAEPEVDPQGLPMQICYVAGAGSPATS